jgi:hypothetical protein
MNPTDTSADTDTTTRRSGIRGAAGLALAGLLTWPAIVLLLHLVQLGEYDPQQQAISELARGRGGALMALAFTAFGVGTAAFGVALHNATRARVAPVLLCLAGVADVVSAVFRADVGTTHTLVGHIHEVTGMVTFGLIVTAMIATVRPLNRLPGGAVLARATAVWVAGPVATFFLIPILGDDRFGIAQRVFIATWLSWLVTGALILNRRAARR